MKILLVGLGGFGRNHLKAWHEMGLGANLFIAERDLDRHAECRAFNVPAERLATDVGEFLDRVDVVDVVTPSTNHFELCRTALNAGKHVFVEKPMTMTSQEAVALHEIAQKNDRLIQVGYYYRYHPISQHLIQLLNQGALGQLRYLAGNFMGFKRARTDVGVTHTDGIHFLDLFNALVGAPPSQVYAVTKDHFGRGMEDFSIVLLDYPGNVTARVESGYIQPGRWRDKVVPNAFTSKEIFLCGSEATAEVDFENESLTLHDVRQEFNGSTWAPVISGSRSLNVGTAGPIKMIVTEFEAFFKCIREKKSPAPNALASGIVLAKLMEALYQSSAQRKTVKLEWSTEETASLERGRP